MGSYLLSYKQRRKPVPVVIDKSALELTAFMGVVYSGNFYVPIDEKMPGARMRLIFDTLENQVIIADEKHYGQLKEEFPEQEIVKVEEMMETPVDELGLDTMRRRMIDTDPLYALFTSGSTGMPKGVVCCHRSVLNYSGRVTETFALDEKTILGNQELSRCYEEDYIIQ